MFNEPVLVNWYKKFNADKTGAERNSFALKFLFINFAVLGQHCSNFSLPDSETFFEALHPNMSFKGLSSFRPAILLYVRLEAERFLVILRLPMLYQPKQRVNEKKMEDT